MSQTEQMRTMNKTAVPHCRSVAVYTVMDCK